MHRPFHTDCALFLSPADFSPVSSPPCMQHRAPQEQGSGGRRAALGSGSALLQRAAEPAAHSPGKAGAPLCCPSGCINASEEGTGRMKAPRQRPKKQAGREAPAPPAGARGSLGAASSRRRGRSQVTSCPQALLLPPQQHPTAATNQPRLRFVPPRRGRGLHHPVLSHGWEGGVHRQVSEVGV